MWRRVSDEVLLQEVLAVRHHRHGQLHSPWVQLGPGVEDAALDKRDMADHLIGVCLRLDWLIMSIKVITYSSDMRREPLGNSDPAFIYIWVTFSWRDIIPKTVIFFSKFDS